MAEHSRVEVVGREVFLASMVGEARGLSTSMHRIALLMRDVYLNPDEVLYRAGERSDEYFFVVSGELTLSRPGAAPSIFGERTVVGTLDATMDRPHTHTAVASKPTHLLRLRATDWADFLEDNFELTRRVVSRVSADVYALRLRPPPLGGFDAPVASTTAPRGELQVIDRILILREVPAFARAGIQTLAVLAQLGSTTFASKGDVLFAPGEAKGFIVVVASGLVGVSWPNSPVTAQFGRGSLLGGAGSLSDEPVGEVRAVESARAIVLPREDYFDVMEEQFSLAQSALVAIGVERVALLDRGA